jgi:hypothetical protein
LDKFIAHQMKGGNMKYHMIVILLMATLLVAVLVGGLIIVGLINLNQNTEGTPQQTVTIMPTPKLTPRPVTNQTQTTGDSIIGSWLNGMVFYPNGTVGSDGMTSWEVNTNENNSYFVISDVLSAGANNPRSVSSTEWIYNPAFDKINKRGSSEFFARGIPTTKPTTKPTVTTIQTQQTQRMNTTTLSPGKFSYSDCLSACKIAFSVDHNNGIFNDCIQTCNIENLKVSN